MFENFSNVIFIAIALAVFIGRTVAQARKSKEEKKAPPPPPPKVAALHFEEKDDDDELGYFKKAAAQSVPKTPKPARQPPKKQPASLLTKAPALKKDTSPPLPSNIDKLFPVKGTAKTLSPEEQEGFSLNLNHLSPMKQAVIMAEILGPPKGLTDR
ncbi:MAG: hypothetical protein FWB99_03135 [Treponema sp.]|nr:hypothetical protein [Treponema sp.]